MSYPLAGTPAFPTFQTNEQNGRGIIRFSGTSNPLTNPATFTFRHLWIVAKYDGASFTGAAGLITNTAGTIGLFGVDTGTTFASLSGMGGVNWRAFVNGSEVSAAAIPAPMDTFKLIEIRADAPVSMAGLVLGRKGTAGAKWAGDFAELFISEDAKLLTDIREMEEHLLSKWAL